MVDSANFIPKTSTGYPLIRAGLWTTGENGDNRRRSITRRITSIGSRTGSNIRLVSKLVSAAHACIVNTGAELILRDFNSANGTLLNGDLVEEAVLQDGDLLTVGPFELRLKIDQLPAEFSQQHSLEQGQGREPRNDDIILRQAQRIEEQQKELNALAAQLELFRNSAANSMSDAEEEHAALAQERAELKAREAQLNQQEKQLNQARRDHEIGHQTVKEQWHEMEERQLTLYGQSAELEKRRLAVNEAQARIEKQKETIQHELNKQRESLAHAQQALEKERAELYALKQEMRFKEVDLAERKAAVEAQAEQLKKDKNAQKCQDLVKLSRKLAQQRSAFETELAQKKAAFEQEIKTRTRALEEREFQLADLSVGLAQKKSAVVRQEKQLQKKRIQQLGYFQELREEIESEIGMREKALTDQVDHINQHSELVYQQLQQLEEKERMLEARRLTLELSDKSGGDNDSGSNDSTELAETETRNDLATELDGRKQQSLAV